MAPATSPSVCYEKRFFKPRFPPKRQIRQGRTLAVWILAAKLPNSDLNFAVDFFVDFFLLFFPRRKARKNPPKNPPQNSPRTLFGKIPLGFLHCCRSLFLKIRSTLKCFPFSSWFSGRGWGQQLLTFQSPAVHWMARASSLNCLSCRNPYQTPHSLNCLPPLHWKPLFFTEKCFVASPPQKSALIPFSGCHKRAVLQKGVFCCECAFALFSG